MADPRTPLVFLMGPTGSGKTAVALELAGTWGTTHDTSIEIVSVDSALVYRGLDIGTAKPSLAERARVPHWMLDLCDPAESYSAARYAEDAQSCLQTIEQRHARPLLVGGTMLYARALTTGFDDLPSANPELRARLEAKAAVEGWPALHAELTDRDPITARRLSPNDSQRIQRALEVIYVTGKPLSQLQGRATAGGRPAVFVSLEPNNRTWLHERLAQRFDCMLAGGLLEEVRALKARSDLHPNLPAIRSVGYRQIWAYLAGECSFEEMRERALAATRQLAKRQLTWLRAIEDRLVIACDAPDATARAVDALRTLLGGSQH